MMFSSIRSAPKDVRFFFEQLKKSRALNSYKAEGGSSSPEMAAFFERGYNLYKNAIPLSVYSKLTDEYFVNEKWFLDTNSNIALPILQKELLKSIDYDSPILSYVQEYFRAFYRAEPNLQQVPKIIVTNPDIESKNFDAAKHRIPAFFHTDYPSELTVHIPLTDINDKTPRTLYLRGSHVSKSVRPMKKYVNTDHLSSFEHVELFAKSRDALIIDVTGVHKAVLSPNLRIMIQLKYTAGNDILDADINYEKTKAILKNANSHFKKFKVYTRKLKDDWQAIFENTELTQKLRRELLSFEGQVLQYF